MFLFEPVRLLSVAAFLLSIAGQISPLQASQQTVVIAVSDLKAAPGCDTTETESVAIRLCEELSANSVVTAMDRSQMHRILDSLNDTCSSTQCLLRKGSILKVDAISEGALGRMGSTWWLDLRVISLHNGRTLSHITLDAKGSLDALLQKIPGAAVQISSAVQNDTPDPARPALSESKTEIRSVTPPDPQNKNRTGLGAAYTFYPASPERDSAGGAYYSMWDTCTVSRVEATVFIAAGRFLNITITPACTYFQKVDKGIRENGITMISVSPGVMYVKRWYPLKVNAGVAIDIDWMFYNEKNFQTNGSETNFSMQGFGVGASAKVGGEFLITPNIGVGADVVFRYSEMQVTDWNFLFGHNSFNIRMPWLGFRFGASVYF